MFGWDILPHMSLSCFVGSDDGVADDSNASGNKIHEAVVVVVVVVIV